MKTADTTWHRHWPADPTTHTAARARFSLDGWQHHVEDLARFHSSSWKPGSSAVILAGDISLAEAKEMAQRSFVANDGAIKQRAQLVLEANDGERRKAVANIARPRLLLDSPFGRNLAKSD